MLVEAALVLPMLLTLMFGIFDFGYQYSVILELRSAAREGGRLAVTDNGCALSKTCGTLRQQRLALEDTIRTRAQGLADRKQIGVSVCYPAAPAVGVSDVTVRLTHPSRSVTGMFKPVLSGTIRSVAVMRLEQLPTFENSAPC